MKPPMTGKARKELKMATAKTNARRKKPSNRATPLPAKYSSGDYVLIGEKNFTKLKSGEKPKGCSPEQVIKAVALKPPTLAAPNLKIKVTQYLIDTSVRGSPSNCMLVRAFKTFAIKNGLDTWSWHVADGDLSFNKNHPGLGKNASRYVYKVPDWVQQLVALWDAKKAIKPFTFSIPGRSAFRRDYNKIGKRGPNKPRDKSKPYGSLVKANPTKCPRRHLGKTVADKDGLAHKLKGALGPDIKFVPVKKKRAA